MIDVIPRFIRLILAICLNLSPDSKVDNIDVEVSSGLITSFEGFSTNYCMNFVELIFIFSNSTVWM